jgi:integrase
MANTISVLRTKLRGQPIWRVESRIGGRRLRRFHRTREAAQADAADRRFQLATAGQLWAALSPQERTEAAAVLGQMRAAGLSVRDVWESYKTHRETRAKASAPLLHAVNELLIAKTRAQLRPRYVAGLEAYLRMFIRGREQMPIALVTTEQLANWFVERNESPSAMASNLGRLSSLFAYAVRRGWATVNPVDSIERPRLEAKPPAVFTVRQCAKLLAACLRRSPDSLAWLAACLFAGVRPEEADALGWSAIDLEAGTIRIDAAVSKVRMRRIVHVERCAIAWLKLAKAKGARLPLPHTTRRRAVRALRGMPYASRAGPKTF